MPRLWNIINKLMIEGMTLMGSFVVIFHSLAIILIHTSSKFIPMTQLEVRIRVTLIISLYGGLDVFAMVLKRGRIRHFVRALSWVSFESLFVAIVRVVFRGDPDTIVLL